MFREWIYIGIFAAVALSVLLIDPGPTEEEPLPAVVIFTQVPARAELMSALNAGDPLLFESSRIVRFNYQNSESEPKFLTPEFHSAASPSLSFDNERIVFSGRKSAEDPWQIWLMDLDGSNKKQVYEGAGNAVSPTFLPDGRIVFSSEINDPGIGRRFALFTCRPDGSELTQITYHPHRDLHASVLHDGRVAMISSPIYPDKKRAEFMVLRPDGTKAQSFYHDRSGFRVKSAVRETDGPEPELVYVRGDDSTDQLVSISYANPDKSMRVIAEGPAGNMQSADILEDDRIIVSTRSAENGMFGLSAVSHTGDEEPVSIYGDNDFHSIQPVAFRTRPIPKKLPSSLNSEKGFGTLLGQNANRSQIPVEGDPETRYVRVMGINGSLGEFELAGDGSFYLEVQADMPVRFLSLNGKKEVLRGPSSWIWMRSGERRACVGCHSGKALAPENVVPEAIHDSPVRITDTSAASDMEVQAIRDVLKTQGVQGNEH